MGKEIEKIILSRNLDYAGWSENICETPDEIARESVCIDFTTPAAFKANYRFIAEHFGAAVIGTTGWNDMADEIIGYFKQCGTPMIYASNFSIGVNVLFAASQFISQKLAKFPQYSPPIDETHHIHKLDAPSGTAKSLADAIDPEGKLERVYGRGGNCGERTKKEIGMHALRGGTVTGEHTVDFFGNDEVFEITHKAGSRQILVDGAIAAAWKLVDKEAGLYTMETLLFG